MFDFIQKIIYAFLSFQEKTLRKKMPQKLKSSFINKTSKKVFSSAASLELTSETTKNKLKLENNVKTILKKYGNDPEKLLGFIKRSGTNVYKIANAKNVLALIGYEEGFIGETKGIKALFLNTVIPVLAGEKAYFSTKSKPIFVVRTSALDCYNTMQQFYKWYAMKLELPGFDSEAQENFQKFLAPHSDEKIKDLSIEEILGLKEAIARDVEAINFIVDLAKNTAGSKNAMKKLTAGGASV